MPWHRLAPEQTARRLRVEIGAGLDAGEATARLHTSGRNELEAEERRRLPAILVGQFLDFMILVLLGAAIVAGLLGEILDAVAILAIVLLNGLFGAVQEYRADRALAALRRMASATARVRRRGETRSVEASELVPGDVVLLEAGDMVPADLRLVECRGLEIDEAALTGESLAVVKQEEALRGEGEIPLAERADMAYRGTAVTRGSGVGLVVATGMGTELGRLAELLRAGVSFATPLQRRLARFARRLAWSILGICGVIFVVGLARGEPVGQMFLVAVALAVAAIPEALPAVVTVALALGGQRLMERQALLRRLPAAEALGSVSVICADKTGTLTQNRMRAEVLVGVGGERRSVSEVDVEQEPWRSLLLGMALCHDVDPELEEASDPTERAMLQAAREVGLDPSKLAESLPRRGEVPFDADRKRMTTLHRGPEGDLLFTKGAPESILPLCRDRLGREAPLGLEGDEVAREVETLAADGYRVLAFAGRSLAAGEGSELAAEERDLTLYGLVGLVDPPRREAPDAVAACLAAGITPVMITGDHPGTARAIARRLGITRNDEPVATSADLEGLSREELEERVAGSRVYARVTPEQKIRIVEALQSRGEVVAMTGDGVNDGPALRRADIGVAMGGRGTDVAREAADMVLLDDNFATIVAAVREGRRIFDNIRKFIRYTMTSNSGEIWTLFLAPLLGLPLPLLPVQILWINLVTDGLPGLALTAEPEERNVMSRPPRPMDESIFAHGMGRHILLIGLLIGLVAFGTQVGALASGIGAWQTMVFTVLTFSQLAHALAIRSERESLFRLGLRSNLPLLGAVLLTVVLQLLVVYLPPLQAVFHTSPLGVRELGICLALPLLVFAVVEMEKAWVRRRGVLPGSGNAE